MNPGDTVVLTIEAVAHGGHCVARHDGQVIFVRHTLPGEQVEAVITRRGKGGRMLFADALEVLTPSADRVTPPCPHAGPSRCGGCDWQHVAVPAQRELKAAVLREQLTRLGGLAEVAGVPLADAVTVSAVAGDQDGLGWRTRVTYAVAPDGVAGLRRNHSHVVEPVTHCRIAHPAVVATGVTSKRWDGYEAVSVTASAAGDRVVVLDPMPPTGDRRAGRDALDGLSGDVSLPGFRGRRWVLEQAAGREWRVDGAGFWQVHPGAADTLVAAVRRMLDPQPGEHLLDLYSGVGLFAGSLAAALGSTGRIDAVELSSQAVRDARRNLHDLPIVRLHESGVEEWLIAQAPDPLLGENDDVGVNLVVLDPPRSGAGEQVMRSLAALRPRAIAYVACDPAALARDLRTATELGLQVAAIEAYDLFPMTHHLETVALLVPGLIAGPLFPAN